MLNILKISNKDTRTTSGTSIVNFKMYFAIYSTANNAEFKQINAGLI